MRDIFIFYFLVTTIKHTRFHNYLIYSIYICTLYIYYCRVLYYNQILIIFFAQLNSLRPSYQAKQKYGLCRENIHLSILAWTLNRPEEMKTNVKIVDDDITELETGPKPEWRQNFNVELSGLTELN